MIIRPGCGGLCYVGTDPAGRGGVIRIALADMTEEQMRGWLEIDEARASKYIDSEGETIEAVFTPLDNQPGQPLPEKPTNEADKTQRKTGYFKKSTK